MARMVRAGRFDKVITLQRVLPKSNNYGSVKRDWEDVKTIRASIEPLQGREYFSGPFMMGENITRIRIRYQPDLKIDRKMRVKYGEQIFDIYSVIDSKERHEELQLMCKEGEAHNG
ncbi:phage head closure protein [Frederiksenia canicola]|uniref:Phage head-tail adapter protein n=1 Tax=Frederiksenia canicola TaxID=123824 RepID=A0AAE7C1G2_9PAST|nr:phage head closure protein [Frederiksenia canicola]QIM64291.1 phage head-tail adapter protein [Frederiksenia canicola]RPE93836.1 SPP1 family predicted phage head-tail adaptor [Frederiksenia canicola]